MPKPWVDALFAKLSIRYGAAFLRQWPDADPELVKADWADVLGGFDGPAVKHALDYLPADKPPTAGQFKALCNAAPVAAVLALPAPVEPQSEAVRARVAAVGQVEGDPKAWAKRLRDIEQNHGGWMPGGGKMTRAAREMWRTALEGEEVAA